MTMVTLSQRPVSLLGHQGEVDMWRNIYSTAHSITQTLKDLTFSKPPSTSSRTTSLTAISDLDLPFPHAVLAPILSLSLPDRIRQELLQCFTSRIAEVQRACNKNFARACAAIPQDSSYELAVDNLRHAFRGIYFRQHLPTFQSKVSDLVVKHQKVPKEPKPSFNHQFTPLLEKYFEHNAYPSAAHRHTIATKSTMTPRQIEVWFQNHRNRAKKEGRTLPRTSSDIPLIQALETLDKTSSPASSSATRFPSYSSDDLSDDDDEPDHDDEDWEANTPSSSTPESLNPPRPAHAFPCVYSSSNRSEDPLSSVKGAFSFPPPVWMRHPTVAPKTHSEIDMDEFISSFAVKLHLRDGARKSCGQRNFDHKGPNRPWYHATVTIPPPAPLPALIRSPSRTTPKLITRLSPMLSTLSSHCQTFRSCRSTSAKRSKASPFPNRRPITHSTFSAASRPCSPESPASRAGSFSSISSSRSRLSSTSSLSSIEPSTPPLSPVASVRLALTPTLTEQDILTLGHLFGLRSDYTPEISPLLHVDFSDTHNQPKTFPSCPEDLLRFPHSSHY